MGITRLYGLTIFLTIGFIQAAVAQVAMQRTALDDYVDRPDSALEWNIAGTSRSTGYRTVLIDFTSQSWLSPADVDRTEWEHRLIVVLPDQCRIDTALLWISGGSNKGIPPSQPDEKLIAIAAATRSVVAELRMVPNQPLEFHHDGEQRTEDDLIAYTWDQFLRTGDPIWPARNPMVKSAVRAMDVIEQLTDRDEQVAEVHNFVVTGASKRGWTTWLTGAVDERVIAIAPIVIDVLNLRKNVENHFASYGFWAPSVGDYVEHRIVQRIDHPRMADLLELVDPFSYLERLSKPKLILNAAGDQFFPPNSSHFYYQQLPGQKHIRYVANADHSLKGSNALQTLIAWYQSILSGEELPRIEWSLASGDVLKVRSTMEPVAVRLWRAHNPDARDFRLESLGKAFSSRELVPSSQLEVPLNRPASGWTAQFVELEFDTGGSETFIVSTEVFILPDVLPFAGKRSDLPASITIRCQMDKQHADALGSGSLPPEVAARVKDVRISTRDGQNGQAMVQVNWIPVGRFEASGEAVTAWLTSRGASSIEYRLESGRPQPLR